MMNKQGEELYKNELQKMDERIRSRDMLITN